MTTAFVPNVKPNTVSRIKSLPADTFFIMEQRQPVDMWNPEDTLDLVPYGIYSHSAHENICRYWESLSNKIQRAHDSENVEIFSRTEGDDFLGITVLKGSEVITYVACGKEKALQLAY